MNEPGGYEPVMISALEHYSYCPRQCALIHLEQTYRDNVHTVRGTIQHARVDDAGYEERDGIHREYALPLWSDRLGLVGRADVVEFRPGGPYPVEHKSGKRRAWGHEAIQLCAQAICLEEMTGQPVTSGAIYYARSRRRREVVFDAELRAVVVEMSAAVRELLSAVGPLPNPANDARCEQCSLISVCMPTVTTRDTRRASAFVDALFNAADESDTTEDN